LSGTIIEYIYFHGNTCIEYWSGGKSALIDTTHIDDYKMYLIDERGAPANTVSAYIRDITQFANYLHTGGTGCFTEVTENELRLFISFLGESGRSPATVSRCIASLRAFFNRLTDKGFFDRSPAAGISSATVPKKPPRIMTDEEIIGLLEQPNGGDPKGCRDKAMLETLYATGIRVSELIALDITDANLETGLIKCRNGRDRIIPIYETAINAIGNYLSFARPAMAAAAERALFVNTSGVRMSRQGFWKVLKGYAENAQIKDDITPQMLLPRTCLKMGWTCVRYRKCWATLIYHRHKCMPAL
jgi:integrase/recombinase XerD